jgi:aldose 1-epimerase
MAAFPLFPFAGRITHGRFEFDGIRVTLPANFPPEPHAIHGQAWQAPWRVDDATSTRTLLSYEHPGDPWPWRYRAEQHFELDGRGLSLGLSLKNLGSSPMPAGLGWHPYFPARDATLTADVTARWVFDPVTLTASPGDLRGAGNLRASRTVANLALDDIFQAGSRGARLTWPHGRVTLTASEVFGLLVVYTPPARQFFCVEPISHVPNAVNSPMPRDDTGLRILQPGATLSGVIRLGVEFR